MIGHCAALVLATFLVSAAGHAVLLPLLRRWAVYDTPNARSLHDAIVPRGGGIAIAIALMAGLAAADTSKLGEGVFELFFFSVAFAALGAWDDWGPRSSVVRLLVQFVLATAFMDVYAGVPEGLWPLSTFGLAVVAAVWVVNLFNFMDGADGFAATQVIVFALGMAGCAVFVGDYRITLTALLLLAAVSGFVPYNWHPARLFMGDSGSYFLGFCIVTVTVLWFEATGSLVVPLILMAPFVCDASCTLARRACRGERFWTAHRNHAYQRAILNGVDVRRVVMLLAGLNVALCWTAAALVVTSCVLPLTGLVLSYGVCGTIWYHASTRYPSVDTASR